MGSKIYTQMVEVKATYYTCDICGIHADKPTYIPKNWFICRSVYDRESEGYGASYTICHKCAGKIHMVEDNQHAKD